MVVELLDLYTHDFPDSRTMQFAVLLFIAYKYSSPALRVIAFADKAHTRSSISLWTGVFSNVTLICFVL